MKSLIPALFCIAFSCSNSTAQNLLPLPRKVEMHKGTFRTDRPFRIENKAGTSVLNPYDTFLAAATVHNDRVRRIVRYVSDSTLAFFLVLLVSHRSGHRITGLYNPSNTVTTYSVGPPY